MWEIVLFIVVVGLLLVLILHEIMSCISNMYYDKEFKSGIEDYIKNNEEELRKKIINEVTVRVIPLYWNAIYTNLSVHEDDVFNKVADIITEKLNQEIEVTNIDKQNS